MRGGRRRGGQGGRFFLVSNLCKLIDPQSAPQVFYWSSREGHGVERMGVEGAEECFCARFRPLALVFGRSPFRFRARHIVKM